MDPALYLDECLMLEVFSFVGGKLAKDASSSSSTTCNYNGGNGCQSTNKRNEEESYEYVEEEVTEEDEDAFHKKKSADKEKDAILDVLDAARYYYNLVLVCKSWENILDKFLHRLVTGLDVDFGHVEGRELPCILWLCRHKLNLRKIKCDDGINLPSVADLPLLIHLLKECDTSQVSIVHMVIHYAELSSNWQPFLVKDCQHLDPVSQQEFQEVLASQCPKIKDLHLNLNSLYFSSGRSSSSWLKEEMGTQFISPSLFSQSSMIESLSVALEGPICDEMLLCRMTKHLPNLRFLFVAHQKDLPGGDVNHNTFRIESNSLEQLLVENFGKRVNLSLDHCPKLQVFRCKGGFFGVFNNPHQRQLMVQQKIVHAGNVPPTCLGLILPVCNPSGYPIGMPFRELLDPSVSFLPTTTRYHLAHTTT